MSRTRSRLRAIPILAVFACGISVARADAPPLPDVVGEYQGTLTLIHPRQDPVPLTLRITRARLHHNGKLYFSGTLTSTFHNRVVPPVLPGSSSRRAKVALIPG